MSEHILRLLDKEGGPADETLSPLLAAPPDVPADSGVSYDTDLQALLYEHAPGMLARRENLVVPTLGEPARYNTALHFALGHGLAYSYDGETVTIHPPA